MNGPRLNSSQMNGNSHRAYSMNRMPPPARNTSTQHDDLIKFIYESWHRVSQEVDRNTGQTAVYYHEQEPTSLKNFEPFDLEAYLGQRSVQNLHSLQNYHQTQH